MSEELTAVAFHEAGHGIMTLWAEQHHLGYFLEKVDLDKQECHLVRPRRSDYLLEAQITLAGIVAESRWQWIPTGILTEHRNRALAMIGCCMSLPDDTAVCDHLVAETRATLARHWRLVEILAGELLTQRVLSGDDVCELLWPPPADTFPFIASPCWSAAP